MSITSYLLVNYEYERAGGPYAAYVMLAMSEAGTIAVALAFILVASVAGNLRFCRTAPLGTLYWVMASDGLFFCYRSLALP